MRTSNSAAGALYAPGSLKESAAALATGELSCEILTRDCLLRLDEVEPDVRAYVEVDREGALACARHLDIELQAGRRRGALHGIPMAVKDVIDVVGMRTMAGSRVLAEVSPAAQDAAIVRALRTAGTVVVGKTNTHEFSNGATTPPTRNPLDTRRIAGGSSGGTAAAVASGSALIGIGADTGGSVRMPAALCGIAAIRPRKGTVAEMSGIIPLAPEFDQWGLMARSAADLQVAWSTVTASEEQPGADPRIVVPSNIEGCLPMIESNVATAFELAVTRLKIAGLRTSRCPFPDLTHWRPLRMVIQMQQALDVHRRAGWWPASRDRYSDEVRRNFEIAEQQPTDLQGARRRLQELDGEIDAILEGGVVLALPTVPVVAPLVSEVETMPRGSDLRHPIIGLLAAATLPFSRPDLASMTIPWWGGSDGLPASMQLVARDESLVLGVATAFSREATP
jgi:aspartyl-tRNA(Asn)/glutamyl-tRNA(Gln) amidotransferase subunit A